MHPSIVPHVANQSPPCGANRPSLENVVCAIAAIAFFAMPFASAARAISPATGRALLAACDVAFVAATLLSLRLQNVKHLQVIILFGAAYALIYAAVAPNFPDFNIYYQGWRKAWLFPLSILLGISLTTQSSTRLRHVIFIILILIAGYGVKQLVHFSEFDRRLIDVQSANIWANQIGGRIRANGLLSSGFHLGMAGCLLGAFGLFSSRPKLLRIACFALAAAAIYASYTRTFALTLFLLVGLSVLRRAPIVCFVALMTFGTAVLVSPLLNARVQNAIGALTGDNRFQNRGASYREFAHHFGSDPFGAAFGFGPGSAGSAIGGPYIQAGTAWLEPHNIFLKYVFELGLPLAIALIGSLVLTTLFVRRDPTPESRLLAISGWIIIIVSGLSITSVEAWPISLYIGTLIGMSISAGKRNPQSPS